MASLSPSSPGWSRGPLAVQAETMVPGTSPGMTVLPGNDGFGGHHLFPERLCPALSFTEKVGRLPCPLFGASRGLPRLPRFGVGDGGFQFLVAHFRGIAGEVEDAAVGAALLLTVHGLLPRF